MTKAPNPKLGEVWRENNAHAPRVVQIVGSDGTHVSILALRKVGEAWTAVAGRYGTNRVSKVRTTRFAQTFTRQSGAMPIVPHETFASLRKARSSFTPRPPAYPVEPGQVWRRSTGDTITFARILQVESVETRGNDARALVEYVWPTDGAWVLRGPSTIAGVRQPARKRWVRLTSFSLVAGYVGPVPCLPNPKICNRELIELLSQAYPGPKVSSPHPET